MPEHTLFFSRSDGHLENHPEAPYDTHPEYVEITVRGWVGLTYQFLRIDPDIYSSDHLAAWDPDLGSWEIISDALADQGLREGHVFSDITIIDDFGNEPEPSKHPIDLGQSLNGGTVIAWGYFREPGDGPPDDPGETTMLSVMTLLDPERRVPNEKNYEVFLYEVETGNYANVQYFPNIVPTVRAYEDEFGMDY